ncbi:MAG: diguanylate cyclase domain-containing protein, partial [Mariprofundus sp.]
MHQRQEQIQGNGHGQLARACNSIHASLEIPAIMRATVTSCLEVVEAKVGAAGLLVDGQMAFSECFKDGTWSHLKYRLNANEDAIEQLVKHGRSYLNNETPRKPKISPEIDAELGGIKQLIAIPIHGKHDGLLGCLLLFNKQYGGFTSADQTALEQLASMTSIAMDNAIQISETRRIEEDLQKSVATYRTLVEQIPAITYIATLDRSRILFVSPQVESILGYSQDAFLARPDLWREQIYINDRERVLSEIKHSHSTGEAFHSEYRICKKNGEQLWFKDAAAVVRDNDQALYLQGVMYDITERKQFEEKLLQMAHFDQLTGLANRSLFHDRLNQVIAQSKRHKQQFALLYLDLDGFKAINDNLGHQSGDEILAETARRLKNSVRETDTVARLGGDEFIIILSDVHASDDIALVADKLLKAISKPFENSKGNPINISIGIAIYPTETSDKDALITAADNAMY